MKISPLYDNNLPKTKIIRLSHSPLTQMLDIHITNTSQNYIKDNKLLYLRYSCVIFDIALRYK